MRIYVTGVSGVGKSTLVKELNKKGVASFDIDSIKGLCHWKNKKTSKKAKYYSGIGREWIESHDYICDVKKLKKLIDKKKEVVVAGSASNQESFLGLFDKIVLLYCRKKVFLRRLSTRNEDNDFAKDKSEQKFILSWYKHFEKKMIEKGAIPINTDGPVSIIVKKILKEKK